MRARLLVVAVLVVGTVTACTTQKTGSPNAGSTSGPGSSAGASSTPSVTASPTDDLLPPRPRELDLAGVDPCTDVLTRDQLRQLAYDLGYQRRPIGGKNDINGGPTCGYASMDPPDQPSRKIGSLITISVSEGAEAWLTDPQRKTSADRHRPATIAGFPALVLPNPVVVANCAVVVDVHDGQYLEVDSTPAGQGAGTSPDPYCAEAQRVAEIVVQNLSAR